MKGRRRRDAELALLVLIAMMLALGDPALAHDVALSRGDYAVEGVRATAELAFAQRSLIALIPALDRNRDDTLTADELQPAREAIARVLADGLVVEGDGARCDGRLESATLFERDGVVLRLSYTCPEPASEVRFDLALLDDLPWGHRHLFQARVGGRSVEEVLFRTRRSIEVLTHPSRPPATAARSDAGAAPSAPTEPPETPEPAEPSPAAGAPSFFVIGVEHILTGYDHLVFLLGLVIVGGSRRALVVVVTAFTVAHSITLGLAVLEVWAPRPSLIEPAIALSIAYVGVENYFVADASKRWRITFPFGLVHGFGFAGVLQELALPRADVPAALVAFNLGVEAGQLAVLAVVLPLLTLARRKTWFERAGIKLASGAIVLAGLFWFVERVGR